MEKQNLIIIGHHPILNDVENILQTLGHNLTRIISDSAEDVDVENSIIIVFDASYTVLINTFIKEKIDFFLFNSVILQLYDHRELKEKTGDVNIYWGKYTGDKQFLLLQGEAESTHSLNELIIDQTIGLVNNISRDTLPFIQTNPEKNIIFVSKDSQLINHISIILGLFRVKYFNTESFILYQPIIGMSSFFYRNLPSPIITEATNVNIDLTSKSLDEIFKSVSVNEDAANEVFYPILCDSPLKINENDNKVHFTGFVELGLLVSTNKNGELTFELCASSKIKTQYCVAQLTNSLSRLIYLCINDKKIHFNSIKPLTEKDENDMISLCEGEGGKNNQDKNLYLIFESICKIYPNKIALQYEDISLTYQELQEKVNSLSRYLHINGFSNQKIAVYFFRSVNLIISILAILKINSSYVPIDPKFPLDRVNTILSLSGIVCILHGSSHKEVFIDNQYLFINVDQLDLIEDANNTPIQITYDNPCAYIIFTSGSTGIPKGVMCTHVGAINMIEYTLQNYPIEKNDKLIQLASCAFDISVWEIFAPFFVGATLYLASDLGYSNVTYLIDTIIKYKITIAHMIPSVLKLFSDAIHTNETPTLKHVVSGGEILTSKIAQMFKMKLPNCMLYHGYGPTETAITSIHHTVTDKDLSSDVIPIGRAIYNTHIRILDANKHMLPLGVPGQLYISGQGLALGYINTEDNPLKFLEIKTDGTIRSYHTGDIVRLRHQGAIEFLGRFDNQVKVLGNRVELSEIESRILLNDKIHRCHVLPFKTEQTQLLIAFFTVKNDITNGEISHAIEQDLKKSLPDYMQPSLYIYLDAIPLLTNSKIDIKSLEKIAMEKFRCESLPSNEIELKIHHYITYLTGLNNAPIDLNLMKLGMNSLSITQLCNYLLDEFHLFLTPKDILNYNTIKSLSTFIKNRSVNATPNINAIITSTPKNSILKLSHAQLRLWFVHQVEEQKSYAYNIIKSYKLAKTLDTKIFASSIRELIKRHEPLRTLIKSAYGNPHQVICHEDNEPYAQLVVNESESMASIIHLSKHTFNLAKEVSAKFYLIDVKNTNYYIFLIVQHNIITDGWSTGVLIKDLSEIYNSKLRGLEPNLKKLEIQYADFAAWQNAMIADGAYHEQIEYWKKQLSDYEELRFPTNSFRSKRQAFDGDLVTLNLPIHKMDDIFSFIKNSSTTLYVYLVSALNLCLYYYCGQNDLIIGSAAAGRRSTQLNDILGFFVNVFPLRTQLEDTDTILDLIQKTHQICFNAISNQDVPFDILVDKLGIERRPDRSPIFQLLFIMQEVENETALVLDNVDVNEIQIDLDTTIYDITINIHKYNQNLIIKCSYNTDLFDKLFITQFMKHFENAITSLHTLINVPIINYLLLDTLDLQVYRNLNQASVFNISESLVSTLNILTCQYATKQAIVKGNASITYADLAMRSNNLAAYIMKNSTAPFVVLFMDKTIELIISMLAVAKAGKAYVILKPSITPIERLRFILSDIEINLLIHDSSGNQPISNMTKEKSILTYDIEKNISHYCEANVSTILQNHDKNNLAYMIFTSGSTGVPKGVMVSHESLMNVLISFRSILDFNHQSVFLSITSPSFDIFQLECWLPLITGSTLVLSEIEEDNISIVEEELKRFSITHMQATPSFWKNLLSQTVNDKFNLIAITGGEYLEESVLKNMQNKFTTVINAYGPTETTVWSTYSDLTHKAYTDIGKPISNTKCYVLNSKNNILPMFCEGQLFITGLGVSNGYHDKKLEKHKFISLENPHTLVVERGYLTGDLVKIDQYSNLNYLHRIDQQVKIRGYRIEIQEIINVICQSPDVLDAYVLAVSSSESRYDAKLIAYVKLINQSVPFADMLISHCQLYLPNYMIPSLFIPLNEFPVTANGKIDLFKLRTIYSSYISPTHNVKLNATESLVSVCWKNLLSLNVIDPDRSFYDVGGHSLMIPVLISTLSDKFNVSITIRDFINNPTIFAISRFIDHKKIFLTVEGQNHETTIT